MSEVMSVQAGSILQGFAGIAGTSDISGIAGVSGTDGGFGAVLGAVMADSARNDISGADVTGGTLTSTAKAYGSAGTAGIAGSAGNTGSDNDSAASGKTGASADSALNVDSGSDGVSVRDTLRAVLAELVSGEEGDEEILNLEVLFEGLTGTEDGEKQGLFTETGAKAFVSAVQKFISRMEHQERREISPEEIMALWQGVSVEEKSAYADILSAIAGKAGVPEEEEFSAGELLSAVVKASVSAAVKLPSAKKKQENDNSEMSAYLMAAFITPDISVQSGAMDTVDGLTASEDMTVPDIAAVQVSQEGGFAGEDITGEFTGDGESAAGGSENSAGAERITAETARVITDELAVMDSEDIAEFCDMLASELRAQVESENAAARQTATPADISRQAFMARVAISGQESGFTSVSERLMQGAVQSETSHDGNGGALQEAYTVSGRGAASEAVQTASEEDISRQGGIAAQGMTYNAALDVDFQEDTVIPQEAVRADDTAAIADRIIYKMSGMGENGEDSITLKLTPENLGEIRVTISRKAGETSVAFVAQKSESAAIIGDRAAALADALTSKGISLREISVSDMGRDSTSSGSKEGQSMNYQGDRQADADNDPGQSRYSRHFYYGDEAEQDDPGSVTERSYFDKEANLWLSI